MSSLYADQILPQSRFASQHPHDTYDSVRYMSAPQALTPLDSAYSFYTADIQQQLQAILQQSVTNTCMSGQNRAPLPPHVRLQPSTPTRSPLGYDSRQDSVTSGPVLPPHDWQMSYMSMGGSVAASQPPFKRARSHQRTPSASTVASNGPDSPYSPSLSYTQIANADYSPNSSAQLADQALFAKNLPTSHQALTGSPYTNINPYIADQGVPTLGSHLAMKSFAFDQHAEEFAPEFIRSSRQSMSSRGNNSPATPHSGNGENAECRNSSGTSTNDLKQPNPNVQLFRSDSQAYQDELFNPTTTFTTEPAPAAKRHAGFLSPHRNLVTERLENANMARSTSPRSAMSREISPFRDGSPLAPALDWRQAGGAVKTAANMRRQQKEDAEQAELAQLQPQLRREPTKTISPKDALLDYVPEAEQLPLFQDNLPPGYRSHTGGTDAWQNGFMAPSFGNLATNPAQQQEAPFRATSADGFAPEHFNFVSLPPEQADQGQIQGTPLQLNSYAPTKMNFSDPNPEFPASLITMDSSISENGPALSSQDSVNNNSNNHATATAVAVANSAMQRPVDTRANTGSYTCPYHGCAQRFDSHNNLRKHNLDFHRSQQLKDDTPGTDSGSPRSMESPAPSTDGMTSAAILARNSQAGPHKCTRINPSTNKPCNTIFSRPYDLTRHEDTIHNNRKQKVRCHMCREEKSFSRHDALTRHMRVVHPEVETFGKRGRRND